MSGIKNVLEGETLRRLAFRFAPTEEIYMLGVTTKPDKGGG